MAGRPSKITPAARQAIAEGLARGQTHEEVAANAGIGVRTVRTWLARANKAEHTKRATGKLPPTERPYLELHEAIVEAEAGADLRALREITQMLNVGVDLITAAAAARIPMKVVDRLHNVAVQLLNRRDAGERLNEDEREYVDMLGGYEAAVAQTEVKILATLQRAILGGDWKAGTWWLERTLPEKYARPAGHARDRAGVGGRPIGATSAPDRPSTGDEPPPRLRLREVRSQ